MYMASLLANNIEKIHNFAVEWNFLKYTFNTSDKKAPSEHQYCFLFWKCDQIELMCWSILPKVWDYIESYLSKEDKHETS